MEALGNELFQIIVQVYPELAPKLTGMLLQLGDEECAACLESQERLAERLDEAFKILDVSGQDAKAPAPEEKRIDPEDGKARSLSELRTLCAGQYSVKEIEAYWAAMRPVAAPAAKPSGTRASPKAAAVAAAAPPASVAAKQPSQPAAAPTAIGDEPIPGLSAFLRELKLAAYTATATAWVEEQGACSLAELLENLEDFAEGIGLKPLERRRLEQGAEAAAQAVLLAAAASGPALLAPAAEEALLKDKQAAQRQKEVEDVLREREELEREMKELEEALEEDRRPRSKAAAKASSTPKAKAPTVRVAPKAKAPAISREEIEWKRQNELEEREYLKKQQARQAAREAEEAAQAAEEKRMARQREAEERTQRAAAELAAKMAAASPGGAADPEGSAGDGDFPALGAEDWQAAGKKGKKKR